MRSSIFGNEEAQPTYARNKGISIAKGEVFTDSDCIPAPIGLKQV